MHGSRHASLERLLLDKSANVRRKAAARLEGAAELPRGVVKLLSVIAFLAVGLLFISGGIFSAASVMHIVVDKVDLPPVPAMPIYTDIPKSQSASKKAQAIESVTEIPRQTLSDTMDTAILHARTPASSYVDADALGLGLFLQRELHQLLARAFDDATRTNIQPPVVPQGIPINNSQ